MSPTTTPDEVIRIGVVGLGRMAQTVHLPFLAELEQFELVAVCDHSRVLADTLGSRYGVPPSRRYHDVERLVESPLDAVAVVTPNHAPCVLPALRAGRHVFVEKPLCWSEIEAEQIAAAAASANAIVAVGYMKRHDPAVERGARELRQLERIFYARLHNFAGGRHRFDRVDFVTKPTDLSRVHLERERRLLDAALIEGVGSDDPARVSLFYSLLELASHDVNLLRALLGPVSRVVSAIASNVDTAPLVTAELLHGTGVRTLLEVAPLFDDARDWDEELVVWSDAGSLALRFSSPFVRNLPTRLSTRRLNGLAVESLRVQESFESPFRRQLVRFADCIRGNTTPETSIEDARVDLQLLGHIARFAELIPSNRPTARTFGAPGRPARNRAPLVEKGRT